VNSRFKKILDRMKLDRHDKNGKTKKKRYYPVDLADPVYRKKE